MIIDGIRDFLSLFWDQLGGGDGPMKRMRLPLGSEVGRVLLGQISSGSRVRTGGPPSYLHIESWHGATQELLVGGQYLVVGRAYHSTFYWAFSGSLPTFLWIVERQSIPASEAPKTDPALG